jgi:tRNA(Arg) A34 adenosine deaminase TadA
MDDEVFLRKAFDVARRARDQGQHPFGAILVDAKGTVLMEQGNAFLQEGHDMTAHAERMIATRASKAWRPPFLAGCTLYSTAEPCAMCAGAIYWAGIGRVVYGQAEHDLKTAAGLDPENPTMSLPCRLSLRPDNARWKSSAPCWPTRPPNCRRISGRTGRDPHPSYFFFVKSA